MTTKEITIKDVFGYIFVFPLVMGFLVYFALSWIGKIVIFKMGRDKIE